MLTSNSAKTALARTSTLFVSNRSELFYSIRCRLRIPRLRRVVSRIENSHLLTCDLYRQGNPVQGWKGELKPREVAHDKIANYDSQASPFAQ